MIETVILVALAIVYFIGCITVHIYNMKIVDYILLSLIWLIILFLFGCVYYVMFIIRY